MSLYSVLTEFVTLSKARPNFFLQRNSNISTRTTIRTLYSNRTRSQQLYCQDQEPSELRSRTIGTTIAIRRTRTRTLLQRYCKNTRTLEREAIRRTRTLGHRLDPKRTLRTDLEHCERHQRYLTKLKGLQTTT